MYNLITDGSALAYANCGGWSFILEGGNCEKSRSGARWDMGSNQMELWAILEGLSALRISSDVTINTDSHYVINGVRKHKHSEQVLWAELYLWLQIHKVRFVKIVKGASNQLHTKAHHLAREAVFSAVKARNVKSIVSSDDFTISPGYRISKSAG